MDNSNNLQTQSRRQGFLEKYKISLQATSDKRAVVLPEKVEVLQRY